MVVVAVVVVVPAIVIVCTRCMYSCRCIPFRWQDFGGVFFGGRGTERGDLTTPWEFFIRVFVFSRFFFGLFCFVYLVVFVTVSPVWLG